MTILQIYQNNRNITNWMYLPANKRCELGRKMLCHRQDFANLPLW